MKSEHRQLVIVCSANSDEESSDIAYAAGVNAFLEKPLQMDAFDRVYSQLLSEDTDSSNCDSDNFDSDSRENIISVEESS